MKYLCSLDTTSLRRFSLWLIVWAAWTAPLLARQIEVCIVNDKTFPVPDDAISVLLEFASEEYGRNVDISFREVERHLLPVELFISDRDALSRFQKSCSRGEVALAFSNREVLASEWFAFAFPPGSGRKAKGHLLGLGNPALGFAIIASFDYGFSSRDANGRPKVYGTILHELGHLFYGGHLDDERSFLYPRGDRFPGWTPETVSAIREGSGRTWDFGTVIPRTGRTESRVTED